jgi:RimJ/RimL family protein N-acetyltransferase
VIPLPEPPLRSGDLVLRPWHLDDAPALVTAWADPDIQRWTAVPANRDLAAAERWIAGEAERRIRWLSFDLVVDRGGDVAGEVGLSSIDRPGRTADIGWWTSAEHRREGVATAAVSLLARWAESTLLMSLVARCDPANPASVAVAHGAGIRVA